MNPIKYMLLFSTSLMTLASCADDFDPFDLQRAVEESLHQEQQQLVQPMAAINLNEDPAPLQPEPENELPIHNEEDADFLRVINETREAYEAQQKEEKEKADDFILRNFHETRKTVLDKRRAKTQLLQETFQTLPRDEQLRALNSFRGERMQILLSHPLNEAEGDLLIALNAMDHNFFKILDQQITSAEALHHLNAHIDNRLNEKLAFISVFFAESEIIAAVILEDEEKEAHSIREESDSVIQKLIKKEELALQQQEEQAALEFKEAQKSELLENLVTALEDNILLDLNEFQSQNERFAADLITSVWEENSEEIVSALRLSRQTPSRQEEDRKRARDAWAARYDKKQ